MKKFLKLLLHRMVLVGAALLVQVAVLILVIWRFNDRFVYFYGVCMLLSIGVVLWIVNDRSNPGYKIAWIIPILLFPIFGGLFYVMFGGNRLSGRTKKKMRDMDRHMAEALVPKHPVREDILQLSRSAGIQSRYIERYAYCPPYQNTMTEYLPSGERKFEVLKRELLKAEHYIFLEYFIIQEGEMWNSILDILVRKVEQGVDVRLIYDDMGCIMTLPYGYDKKLEKLGIKTCVFNPFIPILTTKLNNRDHRKIAVIDGHTGITGGINLADEYINAYEKHGRWRDAAILLKGEAVWSLTVMFLTMWGYLRGSEDDFEQYRPQIHQIKREATDGYIQPYADNPLDDEPVGETVYLNLISRARQYIYINTPYLIIDNEMVTALCGAAKGGVDVRIVTPHIADKKFVHAVTRAYYEVLLESGVRIYEYTPGFIHAKTFAVDDDYGTVGTVNLDYRSLYLHFECGVWMYRSSSVLAVKEDFLKHLSECQEITLGDCRSVRWYRRLGRSILRVFAPLL